MGISYRSLFVVGVRWNDVTRVEKEVVEVTVYDRKTGQPVKETERKETEFVGDKVLTDELREGFENANDGELTIVDDYDGTPILLGVVIRDSDNSRDDGDLCVGINAIRVPALVVDVQRKLRMYGIKQVPEIFAWVQIC